MIVGCYTLDLYCDCPECQIQETFPQQFVGKTFQACVREAREKGWRISTNAMTAYCPQCAPLFTKNKRAQFIHKEHQYST
jgi:hypothetical protein